MILTRKIDTLIALTIFLKKYKKMQKKVQTNVPHEHIAVILAASPNSNFPI